MRRLLLLLPWLLAAPALAESRFALAIGSNVGHGTDEPLRWAEQDAERFNALLGQLGGVPEDRRVMVLGEGVAPLKLALARVRGRIEEARRAGERTLLFVYYSGHGDPSSLRLAGERLPLSELQAMLREVPATTTVAILDACHSGSVVSGRSKGLGRAPGFDVSFVRQTGPEGRVFITSSGAQEVAQESDSLQGSYFTHHLLSGLRGAADRDGDGRVSLSEAYQHVYHRTLVTSHGSTAAVQHPELMSQLAGEGDLFLTYLDRSQAQLELPAGLGGSVMVVEERTQQVVAEVEPGSLAPVHLALPSGRYRVQVRRGGDVLFGRVYLPWGGRQRLAPEQLEQRTLAQHQQKGALLAPVAWRLGVGLGAARSHISGGGWGPLAGALLERHSEGRLSLGAQLGLGVSQGTGRYLRFRSVELEAGASAGVLQPLRSLQLGAHGGLALVGVFQHSVHLEAERVRELTGVDPRFDKVALGVSASASVGAELPLRGPWALWTRLTGRATLLREDLDGLRLQPGVHLLVGTSWDR